MTTKDKAGALPPAVYAVQPSGIASDQRKSILLHRIPHHNQLSVYNLWSMGMFLRCSRITERYKLMNVRQILMTKKLKMNKSRACQESVYYPIHMGRGVRAFVRLRL